MSSVVTTQFGLMWCLKNPYIMDTVQNSNRVISNQPAVPVNRPLIQCYQHRSFSFYPYLTVFNPFLIFKTYIPKTHLNIILAPVSHSFEYTLSWRFAYQNSGVILPQHSRPTCRPNITYSLHNLTVLKEWLKPPNFSVCNFSIQVISERCLKATGIIGNTS
jgi:hypothetical protein